MEVTRFCWGEHGHVLRHLPFREQSSGPPPGNSKDSPQLKQISRRWGVRSFVVPFFQDTRQTTSFSLFLELLC